MTSPTLFPDVEVLLVGYLEGLVASSGQVDTETPGDFTGLLPFIRVYRFGGFADPFNDFADIQLDVFADLRSVGFPLARQIQSLLMGPPPPIALLDRVDCTAGPRELEWADKDTVRRWGATYRVVSRRRATS